MCGGADFKIPKKGHTFTPVYTAMFVQICRDFSTLPDPRTLKASEIRWFYESLRPELIRAANVKGG